MTRSVAEVIGFRASHDVPYHECVWCGAYLSGLDGPCDENPNEPTADDLLAWLRERDVAVWPGRGPYDDSQALTDVPVFLCVKRGFDETLCMDPTPTLLAALERAVLAVAGES